MLKMDYSTKIIDYCNDLRSMINNIDTNAISQFINLMKQAAEHGQRVYICGNGGSASTASHFAGDYNKGLKDYGFDFICLSDNLPAMMAIANDISYDEIFRYQVKNKLNANDIVIGISGSGNSKNIVNVLNYAKECGAYTIGITGYDGGLVKQISDLNIHFPIKDMQVVEDLHLILNHMTMRILKEEKENENFIN